MRLSLKSLGLLFIATLAAGTAQAKSPLWMRDAAISPDGTQIAFTYMGDIWTVEAGGGQARRLTMTDNAYEASPVWSPDSRTIAFRSDRAGDFDIYTIDAAGGTALRLTFHSADETPQAFTPDGKNILFSATIQDPAESALFPSAKMTELYSIPVTGGNPVQVAAVPVQMPWFSPTNPDIVFYQDYKGTEDQWRKHHTSPPTRDIWSLDLSSGRHVNITDRYGEDRNPVVSPDGKTLYFLSERDGKSMNVYSMPPQRGGEVLQLTSFTTHPVRFLSGSSTGVLAFTYDGELYTMIHGREPAKVSVDIIADHYEPVKRIDVKSAGESVLSPDGKYVAFINRGEIFVTSAEYSTTNQITHTVEAESDVQWHPDGRKLIYTSERDGHWNIYTASISRDDDPDFPNATVIVEEALFPASDAIERTCPSYSPDGSQIAFLQDRSKLMVMDCKTGYVRQITDRYAKKSRDGRLDYSWSPDGKWILAAGVLNQRDPYSDIFIVNVADGSLVPLTETGYFDSSPRFALNGEAVVFLSDRYGMRNHASWGSLKDVMIVFLNDDAYDRFRLSEEDYSILKELEKSNNTPAGKGKKSEKSAKEAEKTVEVDPHGIQDRIIRLTPSSAEISDALITPDGKTLYYLASFEKGYDLWKKDLRKGDLKMSGKLNTSRGSLAADKDGKDLFIFSKGGIKKMGIRDDKISSVSFGGKMQLDEAAERAYMFDYVKRQEREMFYDKAMHGVDWESLTEHYRRFLPHISNNYDFAAMLGEMLGELNVSHTGGRYTAPDNPDADNTACLGLIFDLTGNGSGGLTVTEVIEGGPMDKSWSRIAAGDAVTAINGREIAEDTPWASLLANLKGTKTLVSYRTANGETREEVVIPISIKQEQELLYRRWVKQREADVERWSNGRLGYVHIRSMGDPSFRSLYADVLGRFNGKEGIVIDIRWNGGGRLHEDIETFFSGRKYLTMVIRGEEVGDMPSRRWNKPSVMVQNEACYSNAHGTPWVYRHMGLGKLVGTPVAGTMTSVNWVKMQDPSMVFGIPVTGFRLPDGSYLENTQLDPDIKVINAPDVIVTGEDSQLREAVQVLLQELSNTSEE